MMSQHSWIFVGCTILLSFLPLVQPKPRIEVTSDQPVVLGSNITFSLKLYNGDQDAYDVQWVELGGAYRRQNYGLNKENGYTSNWTLWYLDEPPAIVDDSHPYVNPGTYTVTATVTYDILFFVRNVGTVLTNFDVNYQFSGTIDPTQPGVVVYRKDPNVITTSNETTLMANAHDPYDFLGKGSNVTWTWFNSTSFIANTTSPSLKQNITTEGSFYYNVTVSGIFNSMTNPNKTLVRNGTFSANVIAKVPISNFTVTGEKWFPHGRLLSLNFLCGGSSPYKYCIQMHPGAYNLTGNETCISPEVTTVCKIPYVWYFGDPGFHSLVIIMENDVSRIINRTLVNVYKVSKQQPLSIIIVPISCTLIALVMIIFGIAFFWENRARYSVEVADFDFGQDDEVPYMTFMERLKDALTASSSSRQRLYNSTDDDPILGSSRRTS